jgi:hypothetical protein
MGPPALAGVVVWSLIQGHASPASGFAWTGLVLAAIGAILIIALHFLVHWSPLDRFVSEYARDQKWGLLMDWAFACLGLGSIGLGLGVSRAFDGANFAWVLIVAGALITLLSIFVCDSHVRRRNRTLTRQEVAKGPPDSTPEGRTHDALVGTAFFGYIIGMAWFCLDSKIAEGLRGSPVEWLRVASFSLANLALVCAGVFVLVIAKGPPKSPVGLAQRAVILCLFEWVAVIGSAVIGR